MKGEGNVSRGASERPVLPSSRLPVTAPGRKKLVVGLIGGMGSGKSRVATEFARHGGRVIAGDRLGHEALRQPEVRDEVVRRWGPGVLDESGDVSRPKLGARVFADP